MDMVQIIENWAYVCGDVTRMRPSAARTNWVVLELQVRSVADVAGFRNLLGALSGPATIEAPAKACVAAGVRERVRLCCRAARRTPGLIVAHPQHLRVETE
jgi:hypothetical protein